MLRTLILCAASLVSLLAQDFRASITGRVLDASGAVVPGAVITATNVDTGVSVRTLTTDTGDYIIPALPPGTYNLKAEAKGFQTYIPERLQLEIQSRPAVDVTLQPGEVTSSITVTSQAAQLETTTASRGDLITGKTLVDLPLNGRNVFALTALAPGVAVTARGTASTFLRTTANNGISSLALSGGQSQTNEALLDGISITGSDGLIQYVPSVDATQEFKVQTNSFDAEYGRFSGGVINAMIKSGTNGFHGAAFEFVRNSAFNARDPFATSIPQFGYNLYGASAGAPVVVPGLYNGKNRTFWFFNYEASREGVPRAFVSTVPTALQRQGDFSSTAVRLSNGQPGPVTVYDPATTRQSGSAYVRDAFPGNRVPAARFDAAARKLIDLYPLPNASGDSITSANNYLLSFKDVTGDDGWITKIDHRFSDRHAIFFRFSLRQWYVTRQGAFKNAVTGDRESRDAPGVALDDTYTITPTTVLNVRYGFSRFLVRSSADNVGTDLASLGFPASFAKSLVVQAIPQIAVSGFTSMSSATKLNRSAETTHTLRGTLTKAAGAHTLKFGAESRLLFSNQGSLGSGVAGSFSFDTVFTRGPNPQATNLQGGYSLASFLLGLGSSGSVSNPGNAADRVPYYGLYLQDDIRLSRRLTVNFGLRYEWEGGYTERYNRLNRGFDFTTDLPIATQAKANYARSPIAQVAASSFQVRGGLLFAGVNGQPANLSNIQRGNLGPRAGAAYRIDDKTVLRGGYGLFYGAGTSSSETRNGFSVSTPFVGTINGSLSAVDVLSNPFPSGLNQPTGAAQGLMTLTGQGVSYTDVERGQARVQQFQVGVQRVLPMQILLEAAYVGSRSARLAVSRQMDAVPAAVIAEAQQTFAATGRNIINDSVANPFQGLITGGSLTGATTSRGQLTRPFPQFTSISAGAAPLGHIQYNALQAQGNKRLGSGLTVKASFTWMKQIEQLRYLNDQDAEPVREIGSFDFNKSLSTGVTYELPFGHGRKWLASGKGVVNTLTAGWQLNVVYVAQNGPPLAVSGAQSLGRSARLDNPTVQQWLSPAAFRQTQTLEYTVTSRLPDVRAAGKSNFDISMFKTTTLRENLKLQFRAESFNTMNHPEWSSPSTTFGQSNFGVVTSTNTFMRQLQFALKVLW